MFSRSSRAEGVDLLRILTDRGSDDHTRTKVKRPQSNGICERFHKTILEEFCQVALRKKIYSTLEELQRDLEIAQRLI